MKFRLKMDLSQFYDDERNLAYILVDPNWEQVMCLQQHVQKLFDVPEVQFLTDDGIYIPPRESIDVIKINDVLRAIVPQNSKKKKKKSKSDLCNISTAGDYSLEINGDKRKYEDEEEGLACSTPNIRPKKKQRTSSKKQNNNNSSIIKSEQSSIKDPEESCIEALQNSNTVTSTIDSKEMDISIPPKPKVFAHPDEVSDDTIKSRKRKRSRKNKKPTAEESQKVEEKESRLSSVPIPISSSTLRLSKSMSTPSQSIKHVHFSDDEGSTLVEKNPKSKEGRVIYRSVLSMDCPARVIKPQVDTSQSKKKDESHLKKPVIQIHEDIVLVPAPEIKDSTSASCGEQQHDDSICSVIEIDDSVMRSAEPDEDDTFYQDINVEKILPLSEELSELPNVGDVVLFKMYRLSEDLTPEISKFICGQCEEIDSNDKTLNCLVLDGIDQLDENIPRVTPSDESHIKRKGKINCFQFFFNEMLEKRVFRM